MLIPTTSKMRLKNNYSYPIGAQAISDALVTVPQYDELNLSFWYSNYHENGLISVLTVHYRHSHVNLSSLNWGIENGLYGTNWNLTVGAVPRDKRSAVNAVLLSSGLAVVKTWLSETRSETWLDSCHMLALKFNPKFGELITL